MAPLSADHHAPVHGHRAPPCAVGARFLPPALRDEAWGGLVAARRRALPVAVAASAGRKEGADSSSCRLRRTPAARSRSPPTTARLRCSTWCVQPWRCRALCSVTTAQRLTVPPTRHVSSRFAGALGAVQAPGSIAPFEPNTLFLWALNSPFHSDSAGLIPLFFLSLAPSVHRGDVVVEEGRPQARILERTRPQRSLCASRDVAERRRADWAALLFL